MSKSVETTKSERGIQFKNRDQTNHLINQMVKTHSKMGVGGGVGLSAPKVGVNQRIILIQAGCENDGDGLMFNDTNSVTRIMVNPVITNFSSHDIEHTLEGSTSIPNISGVVERYKNIRVAFLEYHGSDSLTPIDENFTGCDSIIIQHEIDHLNGILFIDRIKENQAMGVINYKAVRMGIEDGQNALIRKYQIVTQILTMLVIILTTTLIMKSYDWKSYTTSFLESRGASTFSDLLISDSRRVELEIRKHNLEYQHKNIQNTRDDGKSNNS